MLPDKPIYRDFVQPYLCKQLQDAGLGAFTNYQWIIKNEDMMLETRAFDHDDYYTSVKDALLKFDPPTYLVPAFSIKDIEVCLPCWTMKHCENGYEVKLDTPDVGVHSAARMPDAFANLLLYVVKQNMVDISRANYAMSRKNYG